MGEETKFSLKLLVDTRSNKVLFGEAGKDFVDFLFYIMLLPIGTIVKLLLKMKDRDRNLNTGCLGELYRSIEAMSGTDYMSKDAVFKSTATPSPPNNTTMLLLKEDGQASLSQRKLYLCTYCFNVCDFAGGVCPSCNRVMSREVTYVAPKSAPIGYVQGAVMYMVMDNLEVKPMSTVSSTSLISKFYVRGAATSLVEKHVQVGFEEGMRILKAMFESPAVLTTAFLENDCLP